MNPSKRKTLKSCFSIVCMIVVAFMVGYWYYKYKIEDRDIGVIDAIPLEEAEEIKFPAVSLCFEDPFLEKNLKEINSNITGQTFRQYLAGELYDETYESIDYSNVTLDFGQFVHSGVVLWQNATPSAITSDSIHHFEVFSGFDWNVFYKCFTMEYVGKEKRKVKKIMFRYDIRRLKSYWPYVNVNGSSVSFLKTAVVIHHPGQFLLFKRGKESKFFYLYGKKETSISFHDLEIIKRRNSRKRKCSDYTDNYDSNVIDTFLTRKGCRPPYVNMSKTYPICNDLNTVDNTKLDFRTQQQLGMTKACKRILKTKFNVKHLKSRNQVSFWDFVISYPEEVKVITQTKDVDVHSLIGNVGGYLGLFLGYSLIQIPDLFCAIIDFIGNRWPRDKKLSQTTLNK